MSFCFLDALCVSNSMKSLGLSFHWLIVPPTHIVVLYKLNHMQCSHMRYRQNSLGNFCLRSDPYMNCFCFLPSECQQLIKWCLALRPSDRPTLEQICDHPWMRATTESPKSPEEPVAGDIRLRTIDTDSSSSTSSSKESL